MASGHVNRANRPNTSMDGPAAARVIFTFRQRGCWQSSIRSRTTLMVSAERPPIIERSPRGAMYPSGSAGPRSATELPSCFDHLRSIAALSARVPRSGSARSGGGVDPAARHQRPGDACALVGERHRRDVYVAARQQPTKPGVAGHGPAFAPSDHSSGAVDHQPTNVPVAALRDPAQALLAAA